MAGDDIDAVFAINVKVPFVLVGELAPAMASRGKGAIVNVGTIAAEFGMPGTSLYGASKAALAFSRRDASYLFHPISAWLDPADEERMIAATRAFAAAIGADPTPDLMTALIASLRRGTRCCPGSLA